jgi:hypothetical protein
LGSRIAKLDDGVLAVLSFDDRERLGAVVANGKGSSTTVGESAQTVDWEHTRFRARLRSSPPRQYGRPQGTEVVAQTPAPSGPPETIP